MAGDRNQRITERYWLTEKGWQAAWLAQQRLEGSTLTEPVASQEEPS